MKTLRRGTVLLAAVMLLLPFGASAACGESPQGADPSWSVDGLNPRVLELALRAQRSAQRAGFGRKGVLAVIDYSLPSTTPRLWILNPNQRKVLLRELVAHGKMSGENYARSFSNRAGSLQTSLGLFEGEETYGGTHGYSLKLRGLEPGVNDNAETRAIVIHGAWYVSPETGKQFGRLGRSWGCPAVGTGVSRSVIDTLKGGGLLFSYYPDNGWLATSRFLH